MRIKNIKKKHKVVILCIGVILCIAIIMNLNIFSFEEEVEKPVYEMTKEEKSKTRGFLNITFKNTEYMTSLEDKLIFYDDDEQGYGVVSSQHQYFTISFEPGKYKFYSEYLELEGEFEITAIAEEKELIIDYHSESYEVFPSASEFYQ